MYIYCNMISLTIKVLCAVCAFVSLCYLCCLNLFNKNLMIASFVLIILRKLNILQALSNSLAFILPR